MGLFKRLRNFSSSSPSTSVSPPISNEHSHSHAEAGHRKQSRKSNVSLVSLSDVTEASLQVWRNLPSKIRHDPSMVSFQQVQQEHNHMHVDEEGRPVNHDDDIMPFEENEDDDDEEEDEMDLDPDDENNSEFITINVTTAEGQNKEIEHIKDSHSQLHKDKITKDFEMTQQPTYSAHQHSHAHPHRSTPPTPKEEDLHDTGQNNSIFSYGKMLVLFVVWFVIMGILTSQPEKVISQKQIAVPINRPRSYVLPKLPTGPKLEIQLTGPFLSEKYNNVTPYYLTLYLQILTSNLDIELIEIDNKDYIQNVTGMWRLPVIDPQSFDTAPQVTKIQTLDIGESTFKNVVEKEGVIRVILQSNFPAILPVRVGYNRSPINIQLGVIFAAFILIFLYVLIIWEIVHRTFAAMLASTMSIAILAAMNDRPTMPEIVKWIDVETILLLFSMMILVAILSETGVFDYLAVYAYKITNGKIWSLIHCLCIFTTLISSVLDNVTTVLLMAPITIRLCEVMDLNPVPILMSIVVHANIGGTMTPVGDPPNIIITSNPYIMHHGVSFTTFTAHMALGVFIVVITTSIHLRIKYRNINNLLFHEPKEIKLLRRNIVVWERAYASISPYTKDASLVRDTLMKKVKLLKHELKKKMIKGIVPTEQYKQTLDEMQHEFPIKNKPLLIKSCFVLLFIICLFFIESIPEINRLSLGWSALLGVILLIIITEKHDMDAIMSRIEWPTLLFFAAMFVLMEAVDRLGLIAWIGHISEQIILSVSEGSRLAVAIIIILWVSAITSAFVDSIPVTTMMIKVVVKLSESSLGLPLQPLVWALAFGPCLGGNGTLVGASANVICAGIAEQHGYKFSFVEYFKVGFPIMIVSVVVTTVYLMVAHVLFAWH